MLLIAFTYKKCVIPNTLSISAHIYLTSDQDA